MNVNPDSKNFHFAREIIDKLIAGNLYLPNVQ